MDRLIQSLSGLPGFSNSVRTTGLRSKIWLLLGISGLILTFIRIVSVTQEYFEDPLMTQVDLKSASESNIFPAVTLCTLNQISCTKASLIEDMLMNLTKGESTALAEQIRGDLPKTCRLFKMAGCATNCTGGDAFLNSTFRDLYDSLLRDSKGAIGESMETTLMEAKFDNVVDSNFSDWGAYFLPMMGNCFHFNFNGKVLEAGVGEEEGLEMLIRLNSNQNIREGIPDGKHGLTLTIQRSLAFPDLKRNRLDLEPGMAHRIPLSRGFWKFAKNCISNWDEAGIETFKNKAVMDAFGNFHYDQNVCNLYCQLESIFKKCKCISTAHEIPDARKQMFLEENGTVVRSCSSKDEECIVDAIVDEPETSCGCKLSCVEETLDILPSQGKWPGDSTWKRIAKKFKIPRPIVNTTEMINFERVNIEEYTDFLWRKDVDSSVMKINIFLRTKESLDFTEKGKFESMWEFLAKMGGSMSVFMGLCFVAIIEVLGTYAIGFWSLVSCQSCKATNKK